MTEYAKPLWLGGGISYEALEHVEQALLAKAKTLDSTTSVWTEIMNTANAARSELLKRPPVMCDLV